jgi:nucleoid DNA-binding protein
MNDKTPPNADEVAPAADTPAIEKPKIELFNHTKQLAKDLSTNFEGITREKAQEIVNEVLNSMKDILLAEGVLGLKHFGSFRVKHQKNMQYYDFREKKVSRTSRNVLVFYPATGVKKLINQIDVADVTQKRLAKKAAAKADS